MTMLGKKHSLETRRKMSLIGKGRLKTSEWKERIRQSLLGVKHTLERRRNISMAHMGKHLSPRTEFKKGHKMSLQIREKISKTLEGENSYLWKGGITSLHCLLRRMDEYKLYRLNILRRDNYVCQECGAKDRKFHIHHIRAFAIILKDFLQQYSQFSPIEDKETLVRLAITYEPFWDMDNAITLCGICHKKTDNYMKPLRNYL